VKLARTLLVLSGLSFFAVLLSMSACLLHWRVANEPGAQRVPELPAVSGILLFAGLTGALISNGTLIQRRKHPLRILLIPPGVALLLYLPVLLLTLIMLV
jgi:hypothetical protein